MKKCGIILIILIFIPFFRVSADSGGYLIKIKDDFPIELYESELEEINADKKIYSTQNEDLLEDLNEYIETTTPNSCIDLIEGFESISLFNSTENEPQSHPWQLDMVNVTGAWDLKTYGNNVKVAVIDSGCHPHEALNGNLLPGKNYFDETEDVSDNIGHGTHVSGIIAAELDCLEIIGTAPKAKIVPLKCFDSNKSSTMDMIIQAIYDAVDIYNCQIINMSWGVNSDNEFLKEAIKYAHDKGVILVAAVGNNYSKALYYPAAYECVIGVGSVTSTKSKSSFSQHNESVFVVAPGSNILSTYKNGGYKKLSGTSQATPMVSGLAAILLSIDATKTPNDFQELLLSTSEDLGDPGYDTDFGYGLINVDLFIKKVLENKSIYISPFCDDDDSSGVYYFNLTDEEQDVFCIKAYYDDYKMNTCTFENIKLFGSEPFFYECEDPTSDIKYMAWKNLNILAPLGNSRTIKNIN